MNPDPLQSQSQTSLVIESQKSNGQIAYEAYQDYFEGRYGEIEHLKSSRDWYHLPLTIQHAWDHAGDVLGVRIAQNIFHQQAQDINNRREWLEELEQNRTGRGAQG